MLANHTINYSAPLSALAGTVTQYYAACRDASGGYVVATTAARAASPSQRSEGVFLAAGAAHGAVPIMYSGVIPAGLGTAATVQPCVVSSTGALTRVPTPTASDDVIGSVLLNGDVCISAMTPVATTIFTDVSLPPYSLVADSDRLGGGTSNTAALQAAIDATPIGGTIAVPFGDYRLSGSAANPGYAVLVNKRVRFMGVGAGQYASGTTFVCDAGVTGFYVPYAAGQDASFSEMSVIAAGKLVTSQPASWAGAAYTVTLAAAGDFRNGQVVRLRGAGGLLPVVTSATACRTVSGSPIVHLAGPLGTFSAGEYLVIGTAYPLRSRVISTTNATLLPVWARSTAYALNSDRLPLTPTGYAYRATSVSGTGTSDAVTEPTWPTSIGGTVIDNPGANQIVWTCTVYSTATAYITMATNALATLAEGTQISRAFDVTGRIKSGAGTTSLLLDNAGQQGDGSTVAPPPFTGSPGVPDLTLEHHDCGIYAAAICKISDCTLGSVGKGFAGAGASFRGSTGDQGGPQNCDFSRVQDVWSFSCFHAVEMADGDANRVKCDQVKSLSSTSYAFVDTSALGSTFDNCHASGGFGFLTGPSANTATLLNNSYCEGGTSSYLGAGTTVIGGVGLSLSGGTSLASGIINKVNIGLAGGDSKFTTYELRLDPNQAWEGYYSDGSYTYGLLHRRTNTASDGVLGYHVYAHTSGTTGRVRYSEAIADHDVPTANTPVGIKWFPDRLLVGGDTAAGLGGTALVNCIAGRRMWTWGSAAPTAGTWVVGDRCWNNYALDAVTNFWRCTVAGTPGTWVAV